MPSPSKHRKGDVERFKKSSIGKSNKNNFVEFSIEERKAIVVARMRRIVRDYVRLQKRGWKVKYISSYLAVLYNTSPTTIKNVRFYKHVEYARTFLYSEEIDEDGAKKYKPVRVGNSSKRITKVEAAAIVHALHQAAENPYVTEHQVAKIIAEELGVTITAVRYYGERFTIDGRDRNTGKEDFYIAHNLRKMRERGEIDKLSSSVKKAIAERNERIAARNSRTAKK